MTDGPADATNAWPSPSTQSNMQRAVNETDGTLPHPSPQSSSQYNATMAQTSNFVREHQQGWFQDRSNEHERHPTGNIGQDVDMGVEAQAAAQDCIYPESLPRSVGFSPSGNNYLARDD